MPTPNLFDIKSYGAIGNGVTNDTEAIVKVIAAIPLTGGRLFFPSGTYLIEQTLTIQTRLSIPEYVHLVFDEGARLEPSGIAVFIQGAVTCHPSQHIFSGTGLVD
jgi:Pectate lyase superfamily protein